MEYAAGTNKAVVKQAITIAEAVSSFRADEDGRCLEKTTMPKAEACLKQELNSRLAGFFLQVSGVFVDSCTTDSESWSQ